MFSREFFHQLEDEINRARYEIDEGYHMSRARLQAAGHIQVIEIDGTEITVGNTTKAYIVTSPLDRLKGKFVQARGVGPRVIAGMEAEADALIAEETALKSETATAFAPHKALLAESRGELTQIRDALTIITNGGPSLDPLPASENTGNG